MDRTYNLLDSEPLLKQATWREAYSFCRKMRMSLITIPNREKQAALTKYGITSNYLNDEANTELKYCLYC
jgi:hypothetical protein